MFNVSVTQTPDPIITKARGGSWKSDTEQSVSALSCSSGRRNPKTTQSATRCGFGTFLCKALAQGFGRGIDLLWTH